MPKKKPQRAPRRPARKAAAKSVAQEALREWQALHPQVHEALKLASDQYASFDGVMGFGIGRKYHQLKKHYAPSAEGHPPLCVRVLVRSKLAESKLPKSQILPKSLWVHGPNDRDVEILLDVIPAGRIRLQDGQASLHTVPTAGCINVGRVFAFGNMAAPSGINSGQFDQHDASLGTVGAVIQRGSVYLAVSAGHVFVNVCRPNSNGQFPLPVDDQMIGIQGQGWQRLTNDGAFLPASLGDTALLNDAAIMALPKSLLSVPDIAVSWPPNFDRSQFATQADIDAAVNSSSSLGFVWCERISGVNSLAAIPIDLMTHYPVGVSLPVCNGDIRNYGPLWQYRFTEPAHTVDGDSGAPVFLQAADQSSTVRLLGFHVAYDDAQSYGYAVNSESILSANIEPEQLNAGYSFV